MGGGGLTWAWAALPEHQPGSWYWSRAPARSLCSLPRQGCREHFGMHYCDKRRSISEAKACFPGVDFSLVRQQGAWPS